MQSEKAETPLDPYRDILGVDFPAGRLRENLRAFADILAALRTLRALDLSDIHPVVVFDPTMGYEPEELP